MQTIIIPMSTSTGDKKEERTCNYLRDSKLNVQNTFLYFYPVYIVISECMVVRAN